MTKKTVEIDVSFLEEVVNLLKTGRANDASKAIEKFLKKPAKGGGVTTQSGGNTPPPRPPVDPGTPV